MDCYFVPLFHSQLIFVLPGTRKKNKVEVHFGGRNTFHHFVHNYVRWIFVLHQQFWPVQQAVRIDRHTTGNYASDVPDFDDFIGWF
jgi:hypothetical protein